MSPTRAEVLDYKRSRFSTRLPVDRLYTASHYWLLESAAGIWRVGFTKFATRMLGDLVETGFSVKAGDPVSLGQTIGWIEGFKAVTDLYCVMAGEFVESNPALAADITLADTRPYDQGWLYSVRGTPEPNSLDVQGYSQILNLAIDKIQGQPLREAEASE